MSENKPYHPSDKKIRKARADGKVIKSQLVTTFIVLFAAVFWFESVFTNFFLKNQILLEYSLLSGVDEVSVSFIRSLKFLLKTIFLGLALIASAAVFGEVLQIGVRVELKPLAVNFSRLNPVAGLKKIFSNFKNCWQLTLRLVLFVAVFLVLFVGLAKSLPLFLPVKLGEVLKYFNDSYLCFAVAGLAVFAVIAATDYLVNRYKFYRELSMSRQELIQEIREEEGDPRMKSARQALHQALTLEKLTKHVRNAKMIVVERA